MKMWKKIMTLVLVLAVALAMAACGTTTGGSTPSGSAPATKPAEEKIDMSKITIDKIKLGEDYTNLSADLKVISHRTDIIDTVFQEYITRFNQTYPNIKISYEAITDYVEDITIRLTTKDWGDICMIPPTVNKDALGDYFVPYGDQATLEKIYNFMNDKSFGGKSYGMTSTGNAQGVVYNKKVFSDAGITSIPKTPDEFLDALQKIKDKTDATPLYSNFSAGWTMVAWDAYIGGSATGDANFMNQILPHASNPFAKKADMTGPYAVYYVLYEAAARGLIEDDPTTTDWEGCKGMINRGEIGTLVLGSWAVVQMQEAGDKPEDIGYMPFPITIDGKQYASAGPDYNFGINVNISDEQKLASMIYVKWLTEESNFAYDQGGVPIAIGSKYPPVLDAFDGVELVVDNPALEGEEDLFTNVNEKSEVGINNNNYPKQAILESALAKDKTLDEIMADWNEKWTKAQKDLNVSVQ